MKKFYNVFTNEKVSPLATQLTWSHYTELLPIKDENKLYYYLNISIQKNLSRNDLRNKIKNKEYERLSNGTKYKLIKQEQTHLIERDNKYILEYCSNPKILTKEYLLI